MGEAGIVGAGRGREAPDAQQRPQDRMSIHMARGRALAVGAGNLALRFIEASFNQMLGSISPLVTLILDVLITGTRYNAAS